MKWSLHDETISNHVQQLSPVGPIVPWCCAAIFSLHDGIPELYHSLSRPRALYVVHEIRKGVTDWQPWIKVAFGHLIWAHSSDSDSSDFGRLCSPGKAQRGNIWAELSQSASIPQSWCWWCEQFWCPGPQPHLCSSLTQHVLSVNVLCSEQKP